jgi:hypothetical protein
MTDWVWVEARVKAIKVKGMGVGIMTPQSYDCPTHIEYVKHLVYV